MSFSQLPAVKKDTENGAPGIFFGPSYFETALVVVVKNRLTSFMDVPQHKNGAL